MSGFIDFLLGFAVVIAVLLVGFFRASAVRNRSLADYHERRAKAAEAQADTLAKIEVARNRARTVGEEDLAKMKQALRQGDRDQLEAP